MKSTLFMAVSKGQQSKEAVEVVRYIGIAPIFVKAVNPTKAQIKELMGYEPNEEPVYHGVKEVDGKSIPFSRVCFIIETDESKCGIKTTQMLNYFINNSYIKGSQSGKYQVIDKYGRTAWADKDTINAKGKIMYKDGTMEANISSDYRPAYEGEPLLVDFIKKYLVIPNIQRYVNGSWVTVDNPNDCECLLENIPNYFKGNISEIKEAIALQPNNKVKALFGIRVTDDGKEYQDIYPVVLSNSTSKYDKLQQEIEDRKANGGLSNRIYEFCDLKEYKVNPTDFSQEPKADDPFAESTENTPW